jgi:plastocyanin
MESESKYSIAINYLDFELEIGRGSGQRYPIRVLRSVAGEADEIMDFPFSDLVLENRLLTLQNALLHSGGERRRIPLPEEQAVQRFGQALFEALFTGEVRSRYAVSAREAISRGKGLRVKLRIQSPLLAALPWEFMYDPEQAEYVCLSRSTPLVRYLELPSPPEPLTVAPPLRILGMIASPRNLAKLDIERERVRVERALEPLRKQGTVRLTWLEGQTWGDLQRAMWRGPWHVFHFIGHGGFDALADEGLIALSNEEGQANLLNATQVGRLLTDHRSLRLVVLNACEGARGSKQDIFSSTAATLVRRGIPAVLAMQYEITDQAAIELSRAFYEAVVDGMPVDAALTEARKAVSLAVVNTLEWGTPVLYMRSPNGVLFHTNPQPPSSHSRSTVPTLEKSSNHSPESPLSLYQDEEGLAALDLGQSSINQEPPTTQITPEAASASSFMREQIVLSQVPPKEAPAPSSTTPPTKDILIPTSPVETVKEAAPSSQLSQPAFGATPSHAPAVSLPLPVKPSRKAPTIHGQHTPTQISQTVGSTQLQQVKRNPNLRLVLAVFLLLVVLISGSIFFVTTRSNNPSPVNPHPTVSTIDSGSGGTTDVHMGQASFIPRSVTISVGSGINLIDDASVSHTIENGTWEGSTPKPGAEPGAPIANNIQFDTASQSQTLGPFDTVGTFLYFCTNTPGMNLTVTVQ